MTTDLSFMDNMTTKDRIHWCELHLSHVGNGSGRRVFGLSRGKVIKVAKNKAGQEQNRLEASAENHYTVVPQIFQVGKDDKWLEVKRATRITRAQFSGITGFYVENTHKVLSSSNPLINISIVGMEFIEELKRMIEDLGLVVSGDCRLVSHYGLIRKKLVTTDFSMSDYLVKTYYTKGKGKRNFGKLD